MGDIAHGLTIPQESDIPIKTQQGLKALRMPERSFTLNARTLALLRLADGKHSARDICQLDHGNRDTAEALAYLQAIGLLKVESAATRLLTELGITQAAVTQPVPVMPAAVAHVGADVTAVKRLLVDWAVKALGPDGSVRLTTRVDKITTRDEALAVLNYMCDLFAGGMSKEAIQSHRADALRLLGVAPVAA